MQILIRTNLFALFENVGCLLHCHITVYSQIVSSLVYLSSFSTFTIKWKKFFLFCLICIFTFLKRRKKTLYIEYFTYSLLFSMLISINRNMSIFLIKNGKDSRTAQIYMHRLNEGFCSK